MDKETVYNVITKIVGPINPIGDSREDEKRKENLLVFLSVLDRMHCQINSIAYDFKDSKRASEKRLGEICNKYLNKIGIED